MTWTLTEYGSGIGYNDGPITSAQFGGLQGLYFDGTTIYLADVDNGHIRAIDGGNSVSTYAVVTNPLGVAVNPGAGVGYASSFSAIRSIPAGGGLSSLFAGFGAGFLDGTGTAARFHSPQGLCLDSSGNLYVADAGNNAIRKVTPAGVVTTIAGNGTAGFVDDFAAFARFNGPTDVAISPDDALLYVADSNNQAVRIVDISSGGTTTLAHMNGLYVLGITTTPAGAIYAVISQTTDGTSTRVVKLTYGRPEAVGGIANLPRNDFACITADAAGNLWTGNFADGGLIKLHDIGSLTNFAIRDTDTHWAKLDQLFGLQAQAPQTRGSHFLVRLRLDDTPRWSVQYDRAQVAAWAGSSAYSVPDDGADERILSVRNSGGAWLSAATFATGAPFHTFFVNGIIAGSGPGGTGDLVLPTAQRTTGTDTPPVPARYVGTAWASQISGAYSTLRTWFAFDLGFVQDACSHFYDGYIEWPFVGLSDDTLGALYLYQSTATTDVVGTNIPGGDFNVPPQTYLPGSTMQCFTAANASVTGDLWGAGTLLYTRMISTVPGASSALSSAAMFGRGDNFRFSFDNAAVLSRAVLVFRIEVDNPAAGYENVVYTRPRLVLRS